MIYCQVSPISPTVWLDQGDFRRIVYIVVITLDDNHHGLYVVIDMVIQCLLIEQRTLIFLLITSVPSFFLDSLECIYGRSSQNCEKFRFFKLYQLAPFYKCVILVSIGAMVDWLSCAWRVICIDKLIGGIDVLFRFPVIFMYWWSSESYQMFWFVKVDYYLLHSTYWFVLIGEDHRWRVDYCNYSNDCCSKKFKILFFPISSHKSYTL